MSINAAGNNAANVDVHRAIPAWIDTSVPVRGVAADYNASITVAAHNQRGNLASFSNFGLQSVHLSAPGSLIYSTVPSSAFDLKYGTSMAAPHVAGAVALYTSVHNASPRAIRDALLASVTPVDSFESVIASGGRLNIPQFLATPPPELNRPPMAVDDEATFFDGPVEIDVLSNDSDPDGDPLSVVAFTHSRWGSVGRQSADSNFLIYTPPSERNIRRDSFTYVVGDGRGGTASATVTVMNGNFVNEPPVVNPDVVTVWQGESVPLTSLLWNDIDPNNDPIFLVCAGTLCGNGEFGPENGIIFIDFHRGEEVPFYRPNPRFTGTDFFRYQITDGELSAWGDVTMHVLAGEDAPVRRPQLRNPTPNQTSALKRPNFRWDTLRNAQAYDLEIHQDQAGNVIRAYTNLTNNSFKPSPTDALEGATTYFWRVRGVGASSATGPWSAFRSFISRAELPDQAPRLLRPAASEPLVSLTPTFSWSVVDLATGYTVHIAQAVPDASGLAFTLSTTGGTTSATLPAGSQLESDQSYFWRARAVNADGAGPWSDWRPFFTGDNDLPPGKPTLVAPAHNAPSVSTIPTLRWQAVPGEVSYRVQIYRVNRAGQVVREYAQVSATQVTVSASEPLAGDRLFDWRVRAENSRGAGAWSVMRRFRTSLPAPGLIAPVEGASHQSLTPTFQWQGVAGATLYTFQIAADSPDPVGIISRRTLETTGTSTTIPSNDPLQDSRTYFWRVKAEGPTLSSFSAWQSFTTQMGPPTAAPTLINPQDGATERLVRPNFEWSAGPRAESFTLQIRRVSSGEVVREYTGLTGTSFQPPLGDGLPGDRLYDWRMRAHNSAGSGPWSDWSRFRTTMLPPILTTPTNHASNQSRTTAFAWNGSAGANNYTFEIAADAPDPTGILSRRTQTIPGTSLTIPANEPLRANRTYFWRVRANGPTTGAYSTWFVFTTGN